MKKENLLITMGCSFTEGVGCYDPQTIPKDMVNRIDHHNGGEVYLKNKERFHEWSWPKRLQKLIKYDHLINLGLGGSSTSGNLKVFIEKYGDIKLSEKYNVLVLWMLPNASRFSFYRNKHVVNIIPSSPRNKYNTYTHNLGMEYVNFLGNIDYDTVLEQVFYIKLMEDHCKFNNYNFKFFLSDYRSKKFFDEVYIGDNHILKDIDVFPDYSKFPEMKSLICDHPNEKGYEYISNLLYDWFLNNSKIIPEIEPLQYTSIWDGQEKQHKINKTII